MATGLPARSEVPPEEKDKIKKHNAKLGLLITFMRTLPDNPDTNDIKQVAVIATALKPNG